MAVEQTSMPLAELLARTLGLNPYSPSLKEITASLELRPDGRVSLLDDGTPALVNGLEVACADLEKGDEVRIGSFHITVLATSQQEAAALGSPRPPSSVPAPGRITPRPWVTLWVRRGEQPPQLIAFRRPTLHIGRKPVVAHDGRTQAYLRLAGDEIEPRHASIRHCLDGTVLVRNRTIRLGVRVNGAPIERTNLQPGDRIQLGPYVLWLATPEEARQAPPPVLTASFGEDGLEGPAREPLGPPPPLHPQPPPTRASRPSRQSRREIELPPEPPRVTRLAAELEPDLPPGERRYQVAVAASSLMVLSLTRGYPGVLDAEQREAILKLLVALEAGWAAPTLALELAIGSPLPAAADPAWRAEVDAVLGRHPLTSGMRWDLADPAGPRLELPGSLRAELEEAEAASTARIKAVVDATGEPGSAAP